MKNIIFIVIFSLFMLLTCQFLVGAEENKSYTGSYKISKEIKFCIARDVIDSEAKDNWVQVTYPDGKNIWVSKNDNISSEDIDCIKVEFIKGKIFTFQGETEKVDDSYTVLFYFKKDSFEKLKKITGQNIGYKMVLVKNSIILKDGVVQEAFFEKAGMSGWDKKSIELLLDGAENR